MATAELLEKASRWAEGDPDPETRAELQSLIRQADVDAIRSQVEGTLTFGTAGLRAAVGAGPLRMNRAVVRMVSAALGAFLLDKHKDRTGPWCVIVGHDARLTSESFTRECIGALLALGINVQYFPGNTPTPLIAFAVRHLASAVAGVVVTASHNPREDNGYKVYLEDGVQITDSDASSVSNRMKELPTPSSIGFVETYEGDPRATVIPESILTAYFKEVSTFVRAPLESSPSRDIRVIYTPLHGVGLASIQRVLSEAGFTVVIPVVHQAQPDGNFPTLPFPNPEVAGVLDGAKNLAVSVDADIVIANDPDADRLAVALPNPRGEGWTSLTGDQIGQLLGDFLLETHPARGGEGGTPLLVTTVVSSPMLQEVAASRGGRCVFSLTGFKWICTASLLECRQDTTLTPVLGYEEALGYCVGPMVRDKDGISAALAFVEMAAKLKEEGKTVMGRLEGLYRKHGVWVSVQRTVRRPGTLGKAEITAAVDRLVAGPRPETLSGVPVSGLIHYLKGAEDRPVYLGSQHLVELQLGDRGKVMVRPSGTEPLLKVYVHLTVKVGQDESVWDAYDTLGKEASAMGDALVSMLWPNA